MQTEQQTQEHRIVNPRSGRFDTEKSSGARTPTSNSTTQATKVKTASTNSGAQGKSLNELRMLQYFKSKWNSFHSRYNSFVMFLYKIFRFTNFLLGFTRRSPEVLREVLRFTYF